MCSDNEIVNNLLKNPSNEVGHDQFSGINSQSVVKNIHKTDCSCASKYLNALDYLSKNSSIELEYIQCAAHKGLKITEDCNTCFYSDNESLSDLHEQEYPHSPQNKSRIRDNSDLCRNSETVKNLANNLPSDLEYIQASQNNSQLTKCNADNIDHDSFILPDIQIPQGSTLEVSTSFNDDNLCISPLLFLQNVLSKKFQKGQKSKSRKSSDVPYTCDLCKKGFCSSSSLIRHCRIHTGEKPYVCPICSRGFTSNFRLKSHYLIHTGVTPYVCKICMKGFRDKSDLIKHELGHAGVKPFVCDICNKSFLQKCLLQSHFHCHTGLKPFPCNVCGKYFAMKRQLQVHFRIHTGEKPFSCNICAKTFNLSGNLKKHYRTHTGEKPYTCEACKKSFSDASSLTKHKFIHLGRKPHVCNICDKSYTKKTSLNLHILSHIGTDSMEHVHFDSFSNYTEGWIPNIKSDD